MKHLALTLTTAIFYNVTVKKKKALSIDYLVDGALIGSLICALFLSACEGEMVSGPEQGKPVSTGIVSMTILQEVGGRVSWSHSNNKITFDRIGVDRYSDVYTMNPDGTELQCLTCGKGNLIPQANNGNPTWHPTGEYIVFQAEDPELEGFPEADPRLEQFVTSPGVGINNNLWLTNADGSLFWQLTHVPNRYGALHPHFSPDGTKLVWSEITSPKLDRMGHWSIKLADFSIENGVPRLANIQTFQPLNLQLYEMHGFSPNGTKILYSGVEEGGYYYDFEIYIMDLSTKQVTQLTNDKEWNEHAHYTADGRYIVWGATKGIEQPRVHTLMETIQNPPKREFWIMKSDGSCKYRLSGFNNPEAPEYISIEGGVGFGDFDWGPDGKTIVAKMRRGLQEVTVLIDFDLSSYFNYIEAQK